MNDFLAKIITSPFFIWTSIALVVVILCRDMFISIEKRLRRDEGLEKQNQEVEAMKSLPIKKNPTKALLENMVTAIEKVNAKVENIYANAKERRPSHRPPIDDTEAIRLIFEEKKTYTQAFDILYPPMQGKEDIDRLSGFEKWRTRVSKKVKKEINKYKM